MRERIGSRPPETATSHRIKGRANIPTGSTPTLVASLALYNHSAPVLESIYYDAGSGSDGYITFTVTINGQQLPYDWANQASALPMQDVAQNLPRGGLLQVWAANSHPTDAQTAYCDGEVCFYAEPLK